MPFKSEAQRKYLWANEPKIARDWTDTYGSGIQAANGGRIPFAEGSKKTSIVERNLANKKAELNFWEEQKDTSEKEEKIAQIQADINRLEGDIGTTAETLLGSGQAPTKGIGSKILEFFLGSGAEGSESTAPERAALEKELLAELSTEKRPIQEFKFSEFQGPSQEEEGWDYRTPKKIGMLEKLRNRFYKPAAGAVNYGGKTYTPAQLNSMNALGGYYSEPARNQRRLEARRTNILNRAAKGKPVGNVNKLLGQYGYTGTPGSGTLQFTGKHEGSSTAGAGYTRDDSGWQSSPFRKGGLATLWRR